MKNISEEIHYKAWEARAVSISLEVLQSELWDFLDSVLNKPLRGLHSNMLYYRKNKIRKLNIKRYL